LTYHDGLQALKDKSGQCLAIFLLYKELWLQSASEEAEVRFSTRYRTVEMFIGMLSLENPMTCFPGDATVMAVLKHPGNDHQNTVMSYPYR
jgi:hypothetical protein